MEFTRLGEGKARCVISEEEILDMGYEMSDLLTNGAKSREFMGKLFQMAEERLGMTFGDGLRTVRADYMGDSRLALTFSSISPDSVQGELQEIITQAMNSISDEAAERISNLLSKQEYGEEDAPRAVTYADRTAFCFAEFDDVRKMVSHLRQNLQVRSALYRIKGKYELMVDWCEAKEADVFTTLFYGEEYASAVIQDASHCCYVEEHGTALLKENALEQLLALSMR